MEDYLTLVNSTTMCHEQWPVFKDILLSGSDSFRPHHTISEIELEDATWAQKIFIIFNLIALHPTLSTRCEEQTPEFHAWLRARVSQFYTGNAPDYGVDPPELLADIIMTIRKMAAPTYHHFGSDKSKGHHCVHGEHPGGRVDGNVDAKAVGE